MSKDAKKHIIDKLRTEKYHLEQDNFIHAWKKFLGLPVQEQLAIRNEWNQYYLKVRGTIAYEIFQEQKKALSEGNIKRVKELADDARQMLIDNDFELKKPISIDPFEFDFGYKVKRYKWIEAKILELSATVNTGVDEIFD